MGRITQYIFWILVLLIVVVYYQGVTKDASTFGGIINTLINTLSGRDAKGQFAPYPTGA